MHGRFAGKEWSGILLYTVDGSITDLKNFSVKAHKFFPLDIGSATYTDFSYDERVADMYDMWDDAMEMQSGLIHTHHTMRAFFSQTDEEELHDNVENYNYYLSLIVNEDGKYDARIAALVTPEVNAIKIKDESGEVKEIRNLTMDTEPYIAMIQCEPLRPTPAPMEGDPFLEWIGKVKEHSAKKNQAATKTYGTTYTYGKSQTVINSQSHLGGMNNRSVTKPVDNSPSFIASLPQNTQNSLYAKIMSVDPDYEFGLETAISEINKECKENEKMSYDAALNEHAEIVFDNIGSVAEDFLNCRLGINAEHKLMYDFVAAISKRKDKKGIVATIISYSQIPKE